MNFFISNLVLCCGRSVCLSETSHESFHFCLLVAMKVFTFLCFKPLYSANFAKLCPLNGWPLSVSTLGIPNTEDAI